MLGNKNKKRVNVKRSRSRRLGATVLEVMFSIFVAIVGLMGIASIIPLAARNAEESNAHNNAITLGKIWTNDFVARGLLSPRSSSVKGYGYNWRWFNDQQMQAGNFTLPIGFHNFRRFGLENPVTGGLVSSTNITTNNSGSSGAAAGTHIWSHQSICIDPMFLSDPNVLRGINTGNSRIAGYRASRFPYYAEWQNPIHDAGAAALNPWADQPRMLRATLGGISSQIPAKLAKDLFQSKDDLSTVIIDDDKTIPAARMFAEGGVKALNDGDYSWMATLVPELAPFFQQAINPTNDYILSVVIMQRRERQFLSSTTVPVPADDQPSGERLVWVQPLSGPFVGGTGGRVRLISNVQVDDSLHVGDWIMLGKNYLAITNGSAQTYASIFRWYRITALDAEASQDFLGNVATDPFHPSANNNQAIWYRDVVLEGPDWLFNNVAGVTPTTGTIMSDVVTVIERSVTLD